MKKTLILLSLAMVLVFAFATAAGAVYAGFEPVSGYGNVPGAYPYNPAAGTTGYLPWADASAQMAANGVDAATSRSAHGGYTTATTKCFACHSAHRATYDATASLRANASLGGQYTCDLCHSGASQVSSRMIEWGATTTTHTYEGISCTTCHKGSIHGRKVSKYGAMNVYMLGNDSDAKLDVFAADTTAQATDANDTEMFDFNTTTEMMNGWFENATVAPGADGNLPFKAAGMEVFGGAAVPADRTLFNWATDKAPLSSPSAGTFAAAKSLATAATCNRSGCHNASAFGVFAFGETDVTSGVTDKTGHTMPIYRPNYTSDATCGPCHPGAPVAGMRNTVLADTDALATREQAGSWTDSNGAASGGDSTGVDGLGTYANGLKTGTTAVTAEEFRRARGYGCDQCHDAIGSVTKTTAFPHATDGIKMFEWASNGDRSITAANVAAGNLWMYAGDINFTQSAMFGPVVASNGTTATVVTVTTMPVLANYNQAFTLISGARGGSAFGKVSDGACLKCHVEAKDYPNRPFIAGGRHSGVSWSVGALASGFPKQTANDQIKTYAGGAQTGVTDDWTYAASVDPGKNVGSAVISLQW